MKVTFEFEGASISLRPEGSLEAAVEVSGGVGKASRWDLFCLETFLSALRNKQEREPIYGNEEVLTA